MQKIAGYSGMEANFLIYNKKREELSFFSSVPPQGLEPWTPTLRVSCSTN